MSEVDLYIGEDGLIYRHFPPEDPKCSPVFDPDGVDIEQDECDLMEIFQSLSAENTRLRAIRDAAQALDNWIGSRVLRGMLYRPEEAASFGRYLFNLRAALATDAPGTEGKDA